METIIVSAFPVGLSDLFNMYVSVHVCRPARILVAILFHILVYTLVFILVYLLVWFMSSIFVMQPYSYLTPCSPTHNCFSCLTLTPSLNHTPTVFHLCFDQWRSLQDLVQLSSRLTSHQEGAGLYVGPALSRTLTQVSRQGAM